MKIYQIEGSSYSGCDGWSTWVCSEVWISYDKAQKHCDKMNKQTYNRYEVVVKDTKD